MLSPLRYRSYGVLQLESWRRVSDSPEAEDIGAQVGQSSAIIFQWRTGCYSSHPRNYTGLAYVNIPGCTEVVDDIGAKIGSYGDYDTVLGSRHKRQFDSSLEKNRNNNTKPRKQRHWFNSAKRNHNLGSKFCQHTKDISQIFSNGIRRTNLTLRDHSPLMSFFCLFHFGTSSLLTEILV